MTTLLGVCLAVQPGPTILVDTCLPSCCGWQELDGGSASQYEQQNLAEAFPFVHACLCEAMRTMPPVSKLLRWVRLSRRLDSSGSVCVA